MVEFRKRHDDGRAFPVGKKATTIAMGQVRRAKSNFNRLVAARLGGKKYLQSEMVFQNFIKYLERLNPDTEIDPEIINRSLDWEEALNDIKSKHPHIIIEKVKDTRMAEFREDLENRGIDNEKVQNLVVAAPEPLSEDEIAEVAGALHTRSDHAVKVDKALKAELTKDVRKWARHSNHFDIRTVDDKEIKSKEDAR